MKKYILLSFLLMFGLLESASAQYGSSIRTGRPGQSIGNFTAGKGLFQVQAGQEFGQVINKNADVTFTKAVTQLILRYGLTETFEVSSLLDFQANETNMGSFSNTQLGISNAQFGVRYHIIDPDGWIPGIGIQYRLKFNDILSTDYRLDNVSSKMIIATGNQLAPNWGLTTNLSLDWGNNQLQPQGGYVISLAHSLNQQWGVVAEAYGGLRPGDLTYSFDLGLSYLVNENLQFDLYGGLNDVGNMKNDVVNYFTSIGVSWRGLTQKRPFNGVPVIEKYLNYDYSKK